MALTQRKIKRHHQGLQPSHYTNLFHWVIQVWNPNQISLSKRLFDIVLAFIMIVVFVIPFAGLLLWLILRQGWSVFYISERLTIGGKPFYLIKLRTMQHPVGNDAAITGGYSKAQFTKDGAILRRYRVDELPQLINVLKGEMSLVGPRPPLRKYAELFPDIYYPVLQTPSGMTGLATLLFDTYEARILAGCTNAADAEAVYVRRCIRRKARLDNLYIHHKSRALDLYILYLTLAKFFSLPGRRANRMCQ